MGPFGLAYCAWTDGCENFVTMFLLFLFDWRVQEIFMMKRGIYVKMSNEWRLVLNYQALS